MNCLQGCRRLNRHRVASDEKQWNAVKVSQVMLKLVMHTTTYIPFATDCSHRMQPFVAEFLFMGHVASTGRPKLLFSLLSMDNDWYAGNIHYICALYTDPPETLANKMPSINATSMGLSWRLILPDAAEDTGTFMLYI